MSSAKFRYSFIFWQICWENTFSFFRQKSINRFVVLEQTTKAFDWKVIGFISRGKIHWNFSLSIPMVWAMISSVHYNVDICTHTFSEYIVIVIKLHCPEKTKTIRHDTFPYMNAKLRKLQYQCNMMTNLKKKPTKIQILKSSNAIAYCEINVLSWGCPHNRSSSSSVATAVPTISISGQQLTHL